MNACNDLDLPSFLEKWREALRFNDGSKSLTSSRIIEEHLWLLQCGEGISHVGNVEGAHGCYLSYKMKAV